MTPLASGARLLVLLASPWLAISACSSDDEGDSVLNSGGSNAGGNGQAGSLSVSGLGGSGILTTGGSTGSGVGGSAGAGGGPYELPPGFTPGEFGGYKLGGSTNGSAGQGSGGDGGEPGGCGTTILGVVRDFKRGDQEDGHPDFQTFAGEGETGIVEERLGSDRKPVYVEEEHLYTTNKANFDQWYRNVDGVNEAYVLALSFEPNAGVLTFYSSAFFPLDGEGFGNQGNDHNFHFTTEVHTHFIYEGGETFTFTGDDDLWVFINDRLVIDLGGLHPELSQTVSIDAEADRLGIEIGGDYALDLFHAERRTTESNFRVETNLAFTDCGEIIDDVIE